MQDSHEQEIAEIARRHLRIGTLETRKMDSLDFHEVSVWEVKAALEAAYQAGRKQAAQDALLTVVYKGATIKVTRYDDVFEFGVGPSWSYEIDGQDRPTWKSSVSEDDAITQAKAVVDQAVPCKCNETDSFCPAHNGQGVEMQPLEDTNGK